MITLLLAGVGLLYRLGTLPHGFLDAEAVNGLLAQDITGHGRDLFTQPGSGSPLLAALIALVGRPFGFDIFSARLGAALAGLGTIVFTALWLRRVFGDIWGVVGGLILAGTFWFMLFSRVALSPVAGALALSLFLWFLVEGMARGTHPNALFWYGGAGIAAGVGYMSDPTLRILPIVLLILLISATHQHGMVMRHNEIIGLLLTILLGLVVAGPFIRHASGTPSVLSFWTNTPGLPGSTIMSWRELLHNYGVTLERIGWPTQGALGLNLPNSPLLGPFIAPWAIAGLAIAIRSIRGRLVTTALLCGAVLLIPAAAITPVHPGRLLTILPLLVALPVAGLRFIVQQTPTLRYRVVAVLLVMVMLAGNAAWSTWSYFSNWVDEPQTAQAFSQSVTASLSAIDQLPGTEWILYSMPGEQHVQQYLQTANHQRLLFNGSEMLPIPIDGSGYLVVPDAGQMPAALLQIMTGTQLPQLSNDQYRIYRVDDRARNQLPLSVPTDTFSDGTRFLGHQVVATSSDQIAVVVAWQLRGNGQAHTVRVRMRPVNGAGQTQIVDALLPGGLVPGPYDLLRLVTFKAPPAGTSVDLSLSLLDANGNVLTAPGLDTDNYLFLNRYTFSH